MAQVVVVARLVELLVVPVVAAAVAAQCQRLLGQKSQRQLEHAGRGLVAEKGEEQAKAAPEEVDAGGGCRPPRAKD